MPVSVLSLPLSVVKPSTVEHFEYTTTRISSDHTSHTFCSLCVCVFETVFFSCCLWWVGLSFFFVAPSLCAVFMLASVFNQDVSKWKTGAVTNMGSSKCTLSPSLSSLSSLSVATTSAVMYFEHTTTRVSSDHTSHTCCYCCFVFLKRHSFLLFVVGWSSFSLLHPLLLQCFNPQLCSIRTCPNGIRGR